MRAAIERRSSEAHGYEESLWTLFAQPSGSWILGAVAAGLVCFGIFQLFHAKYARLAPPRLAA
jgi:hypothetical protein